MFKQLLLTSFICVLGEFGAILGGFGIHDVTKGVKILKFRISDIVIGFLSPKNLPMHIFRPKQWFYQVLLRFPFFPL